jgi:hypothetical protein
MRLELFGAALLSITGLLYSGGPSPASQSSQKPAVSPRFQSEVTRLSAEGLTLIEAVEADLSGPGLHHLAAIFRRDKPSAPNQTSEFRIIESRDAGARTIFRRNDFYFSFSGLKKEAELNGTDINKDGLKEILVQSSSGGNCWACNPTEIYQIGDRGAVLVAAGPIQRIADLDGDGSQELIITDSRWEVYDDFSHAAAPGAPMVYSWKNGRYVYCSRDFGTFYKSEVEKLRRDIEEQRAGITDISDDFYLGRVVSLAITYAHMGEIDQGVAELEVLLKVDVKAKEQADRRLNVLKDFRSGESSKMLRAMKYGDPLPLG